MSALPSTAKQSLVERVHEELPGLLEDFCNQHNWAQLGLNSSHANIQDMALQHAGFLLEEVGFSIKVMNFSSMDENIISYNLIRPTN